MESLQLQLLIIVVFLLTASLFYLILFFGFRRKLSLLWLCVFCVAQAGKALCRADAAILIQHFDLTPAAARVGTMISFYTGGISLIAFLLYEFAVPNRNRFLLGFTALSLLFIWTGWTYLPAVLGPALVIASYGRYHGMAGSNWSIIGLLLFSIAAYLEQGTASRIGYFLGIIGFIVMMTLFVGQQITQQLRQQQQTSLRSSRLENELLKRSIQPHFLFNSLASLQELIDQNPDKASHFVDQLADELRMLTQMSGRQLVSLREEMAMCRAHLAIMGYRKNVKFRLETHGLDGTEVVPPAIFHTLVENGVTHGYSYRQTGLFRLSKTQTRGGIQYTFFNDGEVIPDETRTGNGTGLRYIRARLEESYPGRWSLDCQPVSGGWQVRIGVVS